MFGAARRQPAAYPPRLPGGLRPEPVVHGQGRHLAAAVTRPRLGEKTQRHAVSAPGDGHTQVRDGFEGTEGGHQGGKLVGPEHRARVGRGGGRRRYPMSWLIPMCHLQPLRCRSRVTSLAILATVSENSSASLSKVAQASPACPNLDSVRPNLSKESKALLLFG